MNIFLRRSLEDQIPISIVYIYEERRHHNKKNDYRQAEKQNTN